MFFKSLPALSIISRKLVSQFLSVALVFGICLFLCVRQCHLPFLCILQYYFQNKTKKSQLNVSTNSEFYLNHQASQNVHLLGRKYFYPDLERGILQNIVLPVSYLLRWFKGSAKPHTKISSYKIKLFGLWYTHTQYVAMRAFLRISH